MSNGTFIYNEKAHTSTLIMKSPRIDSRVVVSPKGIAYEAIYTGEQKEQCAEEARAMTEEQHHALATMLTISITQAIGLTLTMAGERRMR